MDGPKQGSEETRAGVDRSPHHDQAGHVRDLFVGTAIE